MMQVETHVPELCRLEYWSSSQHGWVTAHSGIALLYPERYVTRLAAKGKTARVTLLDADQAITGPCSHCEEQHAAPYDGGCLL